MQLQGYLKKSMRPDKKFTINPPDQFLQLENKPLDSWLSKCVMVLHTMKQL